MGSSSIAHVAAATTMIAGLAFASGCAHKGMTAPPQAPISQTTTTSSGPSETSTGGSKNELVVSEELLRACKLDMGNAQEAPKFDFDQSFIRAEDRGVLDQVARCVTTGPLKGRTLRLTGRADPRGEQEYNMTLGSSRADAVARYLRALGVTSNQLTETSRGKLDATGTDEASWQLDRRVDIQ